MSKSNEVFPKVLKRNVRPKMPKVDRSNLGKYFRNADEFYEPYRSPEREKAIDDGFQKWIMKHPAFGCTIARMCRLFNDSYQRVKEKAFRREI